MFDCRTIGVLLAGVLVIKIFVVHRCKDGSNLHHFSKTNGEPGALYCQLNIASLPISTLRTSAGFIVKSPYESENHKKLHHFSTPHFFHGN